MNRIRGRGRPDWRRRMIAAALLFCAQAPARAHHAPAVREGATVGVAIPAIAHGEMAVIDRHRAAIVRLAENRPQTDPTLRRLAGFVSLQRFACLWGLVPGSLSDDDSPFNECAHAYLAGTRALLGHMAAMPGDVSAARAIETRIAAEIAADSTASALCSNSGQMFDSGVVLAPDWSAASRHLPTMLSFFGLALISAAGLWGASRGLRRRGADA